jgi:hypothetical protein
MISVLRQLKCNDSGRAIVFGNVVVNELAHRGLLTIGIAA